MDYSRFLKVSIVLLVAFPLLSYLLSLAFESRPNFITTFLISGIVVGWQFLQCHRQEFPLGIRFTIYLSFTLFLGLLGYVLTDFGDRNIWSVLTLSLLGSIAGAGLLKKTETKKEIATHEHRKPPN